MPLSVPSDKACCTTDTAFSYRSARGIHRLRGVPPTAQGTRPTEVKWAHSTNSTAKLIPKPTPASSGLSVWRGSSAVIQRPSRNIDTCGFRNAETSLSRPRPAILDWPISRNMLSSLPISVSLFWKRMPLFCLSHDFAAIGRKWLLGSWTQLTSRFHSSNFSSCVSRSNPVRLVSNPYNSGRRAAIHSRPVARANNSASRSATTIPSSALPVSSRMRP